MSSFHNLKFKIVLWVITAIVRERGTQRERKKGWRKLSLRDEKCYYLEAMKIYATKSCVSFATDCKGNFSQFSQFFSLGFCYKRLQESMQEHSDWFVSLMGCENTTMSCQEQQPILLERSRPFLRESLPPSDS